MINEKLKKLKYLINRIFLKVYLDVYVSQKQISSFHQSHLSFYNIVSFMFL